MTVALDELNRKRDIDVPTGLHELLRPDEEEKLKKDLERISEARRAAALAGSSLRLS